MFASRYWVGGSGTWDASSTSHWASSSGGSSGASAPTQADDVFFDANSGTGTITASGASCRSLDCTGYTGTFYPAVISIYGSLTLVSGMTLTNTSCTLTFRTGSSASITMAGKTLGTFGAVVINATGGTVTLQDALSCYSLTLTAGTLDTNGKTVTVSSSLNLSGSTTRVLTLGASTVNVSNFAAMNLSTTTNLTVNAGTSTLAFGGNNSTVNLGGFTWYNITTTTSSTSTIPISGAFSCNNLTISNTGGYARWTLDSNITVTGTLTVTGATQNTTRISLASNTRATARTITAAAVSLTNVSFEDITCAGAATWSGTSVGDIGGNTNLTADGARTLYWVHGASASYNFFGGGRWSTSSGGSVGADDPLPQDTVKFDANSFSATGKTVSLNAISVSSEMFMPAMDWTGATNSPTMSYGAGANPAFRGSITLISGMTFTPWASTNFVNRGSITITTAGKALDSTISFMGGGTVTLGDDITLSTSGTLNLYRGTFTANGFNVTARKFQTVSGGTKTINMGTGTWTLAGAGTSPWVMADASNVTVNASSSTLALSVGSSSSSNAFTGGGKTYHIVTIAWNNLGNANGKKITFDSGNTFSTLKVLANLTAIFQLGLTSGRSYHVTATVTGSNGNIDVILGGTTAFTLAHGSSQTGSYTAGATDTNLTLTADASFDGALTVMSIRDIGDVPAGTNPAMTTAIARVEQDFSYNSLMVGGIGGEAEAVALFGLDDNIVFNLFRSGVFHVGKPFKFVHVLLSLAGLNSAVAVDSGCVITPILCFNHGTLRFTGAAINAATIEELLYRTPAEAYNGFIKLTPENFAYEDGVNTGAQGYNDVYLELQFTNTAGEAVGVPSVSLPIIIRVEPEEV